MTEPRTRCHACDAEIPVDPREAEVGGGRVMYFECPECDHRHPYAMLTLAGVKIRDRLDQRIATAKRKDGALTHSQVRKHNQQVARLRKGIAKHVRRLDPARDQWAVQELA